MLIRCALEPVPTPATQLVDTARPELGHSTMLSQEGRAGPSHSAGNLEKAANAIDYGGETEMVQDDEAPTPAAPRRLVAPPVTLQPLLPPPQLR